MSEASHTATWKAIWQCISHEPYLRLAQAKSQATVNSHTWVVRGVGDDKPSSSRNVNNVAARGIFELEAAQMLCSIELSNTGTEYETIVACVK
jgi:hypothetical protein